MGAGRFFGDKALVGMWVSVLNTTLVGPFDVGFELGVGRSHGIWGAKDRTGRCGD